MENGHGDGMDDTFVRQVPDDERVSEAVVAAIVEATDGSRNPTGMNPLYGTLDPDALDDLFRDHDGRLVFHHGGCEVAVEEGKRVVATPRS